MAGHLYAGGVGRFTPLAGPPIVVWQDERVAAIDAKLAAIAVIPPPVRTTEQWYRLDRLLDLRFSIRPVPPLRPSVPVIPGRAT